MLIGGGPLEWCSKNIKVVCHSSAEAESSAGCLAAKASVYVRSVANSVGFEIRDGIIMLMDSEAAAHFIRWQHYLRWCQQHHYVQLVFVPGKRQLADALTKPVDITLLREFRSAVYGA